jgi:hypothetical protein
MLLGPKRPFEGGDAVAMKGNHDELVAPDSPELKPACVISEDNIDGELVKFDTVGLVQAGWKLKRCCCGCWRLCRADLLTYLVNVS